MSLHEYLMQSFLPLSDSQLLSLPKVSLLKTSSIVIFVSLTPSYCILIYHFLKNTINLAVLVCSYTANQYIQMSQIGPNLVKLQCEMECPCFTLLKTAGNGSKLANSKLVLEKRTSYVFRCLKFNEKAINLLLQKVQELNVERCYQLTFSPNCLLNLDQALLLPLLLKLTIMENSRHGINLLSLFHGYQIMVGKISI